MRIHRHTHAYTHFFIATQQNTSQDYFFNTTKLSATAKFAFKRLFVAPNITQSQV